jgi:hypothetical protein
MTPQFLHIYLDKSPKETQNIPGWSNQKLQNDSVLSRLRAAVKAEREKMSSYTFNQTQNSNVELGEDSDEVENPRLSRVRYRSDTEKSESKKVIKIRSKVTSIYRCTLLVKSKAKSVFDMVWIKAYLFPVFTLSNEHKFPWLLFE